MDLLPNFKGFPPGKLSYLTGGAYCGFSPSHALAYSSISIEAAELKEQHPEEFLNTCENMKPNEYSSKEMYKRNKENFNKFLKHKVRSK